LTQANFFCLIEGMKRSILLTFIAFLFFLSCRNKDANKTEITGLLSDGFPAIYFLGEIDSGLTPNCGTATPATAANTGTPTQPGAPAQTGGSTSNNTRFSIISQLIFKTRETLNIRYIYDSTQIQGRVDSQQGFVLSGGALNKTVQGNIGTVEWFNQGINVDTSLQSAQQISFFNIEINLTGTFSDTNSAGTNSNLLNQCFTLDGVNCTSGQSSTQCFTSDNRTCLVQNTATDARSVTIRGTLRCNAPNVVPN